MKVNLGFCAICTQMCCKICDLLNHGEMSDSPSFPFCHILAVL